jgi:hypothetical protein
MKTGWASPRRAGQLEEPDPRPLEKQIGSPRQAATNCRSEFPPQKPAHHRLRPESPQ